MKNYTQNDDSPMDDIHIGDRGSLLRALRETDLFCILEGKGHFILPESHKFEIGEADRLP